jgi:hypothetical protein
MSVLDIRKIMFCKKNYIFITWQLSVQEGPIATASAGKVPRQK